MRALVVTNMWPTPSEPQLGSFVRDQVSALQELEGVDVEVFSFPLGGARAYVSAARELRRRYRREHFDVVHAHFGLTAWPSLAVRGAPHAVTLPYLARFVGTHVVDRPRAYVLPGALAGFLRGHGLTVDDAPAHAAVEVATFEGYAEQGARAILEAKATGQCKVSWQRTTRAIPAGSVRVSTDQPLGAIAVYLSEPESDDGVIANGLLAPPAVGGEFAVLRVVD